MLNPSTIGHAEHIHAIGILHASPEHVYLGRVSGGVADVRRRWCMDL
jgi:hypothetical protein